MKSHKYFDVFTTKELDFMTLINKDGTRGIPTFSQRTYSYRILIRRQKGIRGKLRLLAKSVKIEIICFLRSPQHAFTTFTESTPPTALGSEALEKLIEGLLNRPQNGQGEQPIESSNSRSSDSEINS